MPASSTVSLRDLQVAVLDAALYGFPAKAAALIVGNGVAAERRLAIYANNIQENFLAALEATFPVIVKLAGRDWFRQTGRTYMRRHPSRTGNLFFVGERFADFLGAELSGGNYEYFSDVARLEWAYQEVMTAADHSEFDFDALATIPPAMYGRLSFELHPAVRLVESPFPILAIWKANQALADDTAAIDLSTGASRVLLTRRDDRIELRELPLADARLLTAFASGKTFNEAAEEALAADPASNLTTALTRLVRLGALVDFSIHS